MNDDINIKINQKRNILFGVKCKICPSQNKYNELIKGNLLSNNKVDFLYYKNGESLFNSAHSIFIKNYKHKKRDYAVYGYEEFKEKTVIDHSRMKMGQYAIFTQRIEDNWNKQNIKGLHEIILDVTDQFTEDIQRKLLSNIIIFGSDENGICNVQNAYNLEQRLFNELHDLLKREQIGIDHEDDTKIDEDQEWDLNVTCVPERNAVFCFATYLTKFREFGCHWITKEEYEKSDDLERLCHDRWKIDENVNDKFNDLLCSNEFYIEMYNYLVDQTDINYSFGPVF